MPNIVVAGSMNADLSINTPRIPDAGETLAGNGFSVFPGGKGANQAVAAARLGAQTGMVACVGADPFGRLLTGALAADGVQTDYVDVLTDIPTGVAVILVENGDNRIILDAGANAHLDEARIRAAEDRIRQADCLLLQLEIPLESVVSAVDIAVRNRVPVHLNPAPFRPLPDELLEKVDILSPNRGECAALTGIDPATPAAMHEALLQLRGRGVRRPVVTLGEEGAAWLEGDRLERCAALAVHAVDTTAAGDAFCAALAVRLASGDTLADAIHYACRASAVSVTRRGAQPSLPKANDVEQA